MTSYFVPTTCASVRVNEPLTYASESAAPRRKLWKTPQSHFRIRMTTKTQSDTTGAGMTALQEFDGTFHLVWIGDERFLESCAAHLDGNCMGRRSRRPNVQRRAPQV